MNGPDDPPKPSPPTDENDDALWPPEPISKLLTWLLGAYLIGGTIALLVILAMNFPELSKAAIKQVAGAKSPAVPVGSYNPFLLATLSGAIGSMVHALSSYALHYARRDFERSWVPWYIVRPLIGGIVALTFVFLFLGNIVTVQTTDGSGSTPLQNLFLLVGLGFLIGIFTEQAVEKLAQIANSVLTSARPRAARGETVAKPSLTRVTPSTIPAGSADTKITADGQNFVAKRSSILVGSRRLTTTFVSATQLEAVVPRSELAKERQLQVTVRTTGPGGGQSAPVALTVGP